MVLVFFMPPGCGHRYGHWPRMHARPSRTGWTNATDLWTNSVRKGAEPLAVGKRRLPVLTLERAREIQLIAQAHAEGDLADLHVGEAQQAGGLEHDSLRDQRLR